MPSAGIENTRYSPSHRCRRALDKKKKTLGRPIFGNRIPIIRSLCDSLCVVFGRMENNLYTHTQLCVCIRRGPTR